MERRTLLSMKGFVCTVPTVKHIPFEVRRYLRSINPIDWLVWKTFVVIYEQKKGTSK